MSKDSEGARLVNCFQKLGCPKTTSLTGSSFDYLFENRNLSSFLKVFCKKVETGELVALSDDEIKTLGNLESSGEMLDDDLLNKALDAFHCEGATNAEDLSEVGTSLEDDVSQLQNYRKELQTSYKHLSIQKTELDSESALLLKRQPILKSNVKREQEACEKVQKQVCCKCFMAVNLKQLEKALEQIFEDHEENCARNVNRETGFPFLSSLKLDGYLGSEEKFLLEIKKCIRKTFMKGEVMSPAIKSEDGNLQTSGIAVCRSHYVELKICLKELHKMTMLATASEKGQKKLMKILSERLTDTRELSFFELQTKLKNLVKASEIANREMSDLLTDIPETTSLYAAKRLENIMAANYFLKSEKQKYLFARQKELLEMLTLQESRLSFVVTVLQQEAEQHHKLNQILDGVQQLVERDTQSLRTREEMLQKLEEEEDLNHDQISLDATSLALATILGNSDLLPGYRELAKSAATARKNHDEQIATLSQHHREEEQRLLRMETTIKEMEETLSSSSVGSAESNKSLDVIKRKVEVMERMVKGMVEEFTSKKKILNSNPAEAWRRQCYIQYLTNREQFASTVKKIDSS